MADPYHDEKPYHMWAGVRSDGGVVALCFTSRRAINLRLALWTFRREAVTCAKCLRKLKEKP